MLLVAGAFLTPAAAGHAQPQIPSSFFGSVTIDGRAAPDGAEVRALIDGVDCSQSPPGERTAIREGDATAYVIHVVHESQRPGCGRDGKVINFTIAGRAALQQGTWQPGPQHLDLSTGTGDIVPLPTSTPTVPGSDPNPPLAGVTETPSPLSRPTGTPPTDDVQLPGTHTPPGGVTGSGGVTVAADDGDGGGSAWGPLLVALGVLGAGGAAAGVVLARRRRSTSQ